MTAEPPGEDQSSTGLAPNVAAALSYIAGPFSAVPLLVFEKRNAFVRFHAWQSTLAFVAVWTAWAVLMQVPVVGWFAALVLSPPLVLILWLVLLVKAYLGDKIVLPVVGRFAERYR
jgi:uncharacterized membrane protein